MKQVTFKAGDFVYSIQEGWDTIILNPGDSQYHLLVGKVAYTEDGKFLTDDLNRSLLLPEEANALGIEVPKRKVVKEGWINIYKSKYSPSGLETFYVHKTEQIAHENANPKGNKNYITSIKISVEVEE